ncbi:MAG: MFS transporter [Anaerolineales bacterium]|nr:MAG: MFS transporter [Anaerolineales bacterium]
MLLSVNIKETNLYMIHSPRSDNTLIELESGPSPRRVLLPLGLGTAISLLGDSTLYTVLPQASIAASVGVTLTMVGILLGINRLVRLLSNPIAGILYDRLPTRRLMITSLFIGFISTTILAIGRGFEIYVLGRVLWGIAWSGIWIGGNTIVLDIANDENRGRLSGRYQMWFFAGIGASAFLGGVFTDSFGFYQGLLISAGLTGMALLMWILYLPETKPHRVNSPRLSQPDSGHIFPWNTAILASVPVFVVRFVLAGVLASTTILWLGSFMGDGIALDSGFIPLATFTGAFVAVRTFIGMISAPFSGKLSDRINRRWLVIAILLAVGSFGLWLMSSVAMTTAVLGAFLASIPGGGIQALAPVIAGDKVRPEVEGRVISVMYTIGDIGSALGPPLALWIVSVAGLTSLYFGCSVFFALTALITLGLEFHDAALLREVGV